MEQQWHNLYENSIVGKHDIPLKILKKLGEYLQIPMSTRMTNSTIRINKQKVGVYGKDVTFDKN